MIKSIYSFEQLNAYKKDDAFALRISALAMGYGFTYDFARFWVQDNADECTAVMSSLDGVFTLSFTKTADKAEIVLFLNTIGYSYVLANDEIAISSNFESGSVMKKLAFNSFNAVKGCEVCRCSIKTLYEMNKEYLGVIDYNEWYADLSHRLRHGTAKIFELRKGRDVLSCACLTVDNAGVLLSHVATKTVLQKNGYGSFLINEITKNEKIDYYALCDSEKNEKFYAALGFEKTENWRMFR